MQKIQPRVSHGFNAQCVVRDHLLKQYDNLEIISVAHPGSHSPDILANIYGEQIQFEVKSCSIFTSPVVPINRTVTRNTQTPIDDLVELFTDGKWNNIASVVDYYRDQDGSIGFPCDGGTPRSGKLPPSLVICDKNDNIALREVRNVIIQHLQDRGDTYFVLVTKNPQLETHIFYTGKGPNVLNAPPIPKIKIARLRTYGASQLNSMRVAIKVSHMLSPSLTLR